MYRKKISIYRILFCLLLISALILLAIAVVVGGNRNANAPERLRILGSYRMDGEAEQALADSVKIDSSALHTVMVSGHFSSDIQKNLELMLCINNIRISMKINGNVVYSHGEKNTALPFSKSEGNTWDFYASPGITRADTVEITLQNIYKGTVTDSIGDCLNSLYMGHGYELFETMLKEKAPFMLLGLAIVLFGLTILIISGIARYYKISEWEHGTALACLAISGGIWVLIDGGYPYTSLLFQNALLFNMIDVAQMYLIPVISAYFILTSLEHPQTKKPAKIQLCVAFVVMTVPMLLQIAGLYDLYELQGIAIVFSILGGAVSFLLLGYESFWLKNRQTRRILFSFLPLIISGLIEISNYYIHYMPERMSIKYGFAITLLLQFIQLLHVIQKHIQAINENTQLKYELLQSRIAIMLSQIQPHFLYNTLNDIRELYHESPVLAEDALVSFTRFLRGNMDSLSQKNPVPFETELKHVKDYIAIEQMRFGERLNVVFNLGCIDFSLPILTVQPLVENAIRHGVMKKREGGTVTIRTFEDSRGYVVEVSDDGVGIESSHEDDGAHTGVNNVRTRLQSICGGNLEITCRVGGGTSAIVRIPKER